MSKVGPEGRSFARITHLDLERLASLASADRDSYFAAYPDWAEYYADRHIATALCQGAALHYIRRDVGVQDFDVYSFYAAHPGRRWYAKRKQPADFGDPKFGCSPDRPEFVGRRVDLLGRAIECGPGETPVHCIRKWLSSARTESAKYLAQKAVVLLDPEVDRGTIVWPLGLGSADQVR